MLRCCRVVLFSALSWALVGNVAEFHAAAADAPAKPKSPVSPQESLQWISLDDGLRIELVAHEPEVVDPVAVRFDEDGRMWVAEYRDYPNGPEGGAKPKSRIKTLEDRDGDGYYETVHVFADELLFCNGIQPWRGGVIATMSGKIAYLKDTDGDHKADVFETWFTGFAEENPQLRVNHPRFGLDNKIYVANGLRGGSAVDARKKDARPVSLAQHDLRFDPITFEYEAIAGNGQFGLTFDDYGNRFLCSNRNPLMHVVFEDRYLAMNKNYVVPKVVNDVVAPAESSKLYPLVDAWVTSILHANQFTAACGIDIYRGDALPKEYYGNSFTCEPTGSLVHREVLTPSGATFTGKSPYEGREFLASRDPWFRPVYCDGGPDGALYVCDMYRAVIEHPQFVPVELRNRPDERYGEDRGRIYRIVGKNFKRDPQRSNALSKAKTETLVELLEHPSAWQRETAQRLLIERRDVTAVKALEKLASEAKSCLGRIHALWTLAGLGQLPTTVLVRGLIDDDLRVREQSLLLAESRLQETEVRDVAAGVMNSGDSRFLFQAALSLPANTPKKADLLVDLLAAHGDDLWIRRAAMLSLGPDASSVLHDLYVEMLERDASPTSATIQTDCDLIRELATAVAPHLSRDRAALLANRLPETASGRSARALNFALWSGLAKGLRDKFADHLEEGWVETTLRAVKDENAAASVRLDACDLLAYAPHDAAAPVLSALAEREADLEVRARALGALAARRERETGPELLRLYPVQTPRFRSQILDAMLGRPERVTLLLDAIEAGKIKARDLDTARTTRLLKSANTETKTRAEKLLAASIPADRNKALEDYKKVLEMKADARHGREVFRKNCATCHKIGDIGNDVGPSIADLRTKTLEQVLTDVIQPNKAIDNNFVTYTVITNDGLTIVGIVAADTPSGVTLKLADGKTASILKKDIDVMESNGLSLMPEGLEKNIPHQDMADVIGFVKNWRYLDGAVPGLGGAATK